ncbi:ABC transporter permease [Mesorhizobium loti]|uniref:ABC transporter permease n=1 Tax=Rhizobium loti TaxID=381 RepID=UPI000410832E|nr:ABC transporter permease [Mesorhizobium loti]
MTSSRAYRTWQQRLGGVALRILVVLACAFLVLPIVAIIPISFSSGTFLSYPLPGLSLRWYEQVLQLSPWLTALRNSLIVASVATIIATVLGTTAACGLALARFPGRGIVIAIFLSPLIVPPIIIALGVYFLYARIGLAGTFTGLILAHAVLGAPFVVITVMATLHGFDRQLLRASRSCGATPLTTFRMITLPIIAPGVLSGAVFAFITSFDEVVVALFIASPAQFTLPRQLFAGLRDQLEPSIVAVATLLIACTLIFLGLFEILRRHALRGLGKA